MATAVYVPPPGRGSTVAFRPSDDHHVGMTELLNDTQVAESLSHLPEWAQDGTTIVRSVEFASFPQAIQAVNRVAEIAESENHPVSYTHLTLPTNREV